MDPSQLPPGVDIAQVPAGPPPPGITSNFTDPETLRAPVIAVNVILLVVTTTFVGMRIYTRKFLNRILSAEDYMCLLALFGSAAHSGLLFYLVNHGNLGKHLWDIQAMSLTPSIAHVTNALGLTYGLVIFLVKLSVLLLLHNLFAVNKMMRYLVFLGIIVSTSFCIALTGYNIAAEVHCVNAASLKSRICIDTWKVTLATGAINTLIDLYILVLPIVMVLKLQLTPRRKLGVVAIFTIGLLAVTASLVRLILTAQRGHSSDAFWDAALTSICSCIEMNVGIVCASVPAMPMFFRQHKLGLSTLNSIRYRLFGKSTSETSTYREGLEKEATAKHKPFHGISLKMTTPSLGMKSTLDTNDVDGAEFGEGHGRRLLARDN